MNDITDESSDETCYRSHDDIISSHYYSDNERISASTTNFIECNISISTIECVEADDEMKTLSSNIELKTIEETGEIDTDALCHKINNIHVANNNHNDKKKKKKKCKNEILTIYDFIIGKPMGSGQFGRVYLAKTRKEHFICCLKMINMKKLKTHQNYKQLETEITIHQRLNHPNVLKLYNWFQHSNKVILILECALYGSMNKDMHSSELGYYDSKTACKYTTQITDALIYCHSLNIIHRDLKTENILLDHYKNVKLCDFGCSTKINDKRTTFCGTAEYISPEMITDKEEISYDKKVDVWALGILIFEMLSGETPFYGTSVDYILRRIKVGRFHMPRDIDNEARDLIKRLLRRNPEKRINLDDVVSHSWIKMYFPNWKLSNSYSESF